MNILELPAWKKSGRKITMLTCYDAWSARILADTPVDMLLVGDSAAMVMHGFDDTIAAEMDVMVNHVRAVKRGAPKKFIVGDLPFLSYRAGLPQSLKNVRALLQAGAQAVKLEGYDDDVHQLVSHLVRSGVPVMGHLGLTPQFLNAFGGFRVQGRGTDDGRRILAQARGLAEAGCFSLVLECVPRALAAEITACVHVPTIGIGAGPDCDGQVLVLQDLLGLSKGFKPKFVRSYLDGGQLIQNAVQSFCADVGAKVFPAEKESYE